MFIVLLGFRIPNTIKELQYSVIIENYDFSNEVGGFSGNIFTIYLFTWKLLWCP